MENLLTVLGHFGLMMLIIVGALAYYAYRSNKSEFDLYCWVVTNRTRFALAAFLSLVVSILYTVAPEGIAFIGFNPDSQPVALAAAIVGSLITTTPGNDPNK